MFESKNSRVLRLESICSKNTIYKRVEQTKLGHLGGLWLTENRDHALALAMENQGKPLEDQ